MSRARAFATAALLAALALPAGLRAETIAFVGATVHPASGPAIPNGTILELVQLVPLGTPVTVV